MGRRVWDQVVTLNVGFMERLHIIDGLTLLICDLVHRLLLAASGHLRTAASGQFVPLATGKNRPR
jgi:hypothetical protein